MLHGYSNQRAVNNKGIVQFKAITVYVADWGPNFEVSCYRFCVKHILCINSYIVLPSLSVQDYA
jgi:hypothetical protein